MIRHPLRLTFILLLVGALGYLLWYLNRPQPIAVIVKSVENGQVERTVANTRAGTVKACRRARLSPSVGGQISVLDIREGDTVKTGDLLLALWNEDIIAELTLAQREAAAAAARARAACIQAEQAQREANRLVRLGKKGVASEDNIDRAVTLAKAKEADCEAARTSTSVNNARIGVVEAQVQRTRLYAPFDGIIAEINGELNEYVTPSPPGIPTQPVVDLIDDSCFYVAAPIDEVDAPDIEVGMPVRVGLDAFGKRRFDGTVRRIAAYVLDVEKQARTVEIEAVFTNEDDLKQLLAGYSADVEVILETRPATLRIPTEAVLENNRVFVFLENEGLLEERTIETGMSNWDHTEVVSGLNAGDLVVVSIDREGVEDGALAKAEQETTP